MIDFSFVKKNSIFITPTKRKEELISIFGKNLNYSIKYLSKNDLISFLSYSYDDEAVSYLMRKGYSYDNSLEILKNSYFIKEGSNKLNLLVELKKELEAENKLSYDKLSKHLFINKDVYVYGYSREDVELIEMLKLLNVSYQFIDEKINNYKHDIYEFDDIEEEVLFFFEKVNKLVLEGVNIKDIALFSYPSEYEMILRKYAKYYCLPINFPSKLTLIESPIFKEFINKSKESDFESAFEYIKNLDDRYSSYKKIVSLVNDILNLNLSKEEKIILLENKSKGVSLKEEKYKYGIDIVDDSYRGNKYIFLLGFSLGSYPVIKRDTDFLLDYEKEICHLNTSTIENKINKNNLISFLINNKNLIISLKKKIGDKVYYDSLLVKELNLNKITYNRDNIRYSKDLMNLEVSSYQDMKNNYGISSKYEKGVDPTSFRYKEYNHSFTKDDAMKISKYIRLSYTSLNDYIRCPFKYYIQSVCGLSDFEKTFEMQLGNLFHDVLEHSLKKEISKEDYIDQINKDFIDIKEKFFVDKLFFQVLEVIEKNKSFNIISSFKDEFGEQTLEYWFDNKTKLYGRVDRILVNEEDKEIIVVDYKTGPTSFDEEYVNIGLSLQLPIYCLLIKKYYPEYTPIGIYIQNILDKEENVDKKYKLSGIMINDEGKLEHLEHGLSGYSKYIKGLRKTAKGYQDTSSLVEKDKFDELIDITENIIKESIENIRSGEFSISPLVVNDQDEACKYCSLRNVCFVKEEDKRYVYIEKENKEESD